MSNWKLDVLFVLSTIPPFLIPQLDLTLLVTTAK